MAVSEWAGIDPTDCLTRLRARAERMERVRLAPPPRLTVSEWADRYRVVSSYSAEPGKWVTAKTPYLREIMDVFCDPRVNRVVFMKCRRIGGTEAGQNVIGYFIDQDPSPIMVVQPTVDDAKDFSKEQLGPMIEDTDCLRRRVSEAKSRDSGNTISAKVFPGGGLYLVGANSPRGFRRRTARVVVLEEVDGYPPSAGTEGDQVALAEGRATTFQHRRKVYINSTPTLKGFSRIEAEYLLSDQRRYFLPCPECGHEQVLVWGQLKFADLDAPHYACAGCGCLIPEERKHWMLARGRWVASHPGRATVGFHISALYSPWVPWSDLVTKWVESEHDLGKRQVFVNAELGETWEERSGDLLDGLALRPRWSGKLPRDVHLLTAGADVQHDRVEIIVRAWAPGEESWLVERIIVLGTPEQASTWRQVDDVLARTWEREDGALLRIDTLCIDSGDSTDAVYAYVKPRFQRRVYATKGYSTPGRPLVARRPSTNNKGRVKLFMVGSDTGLDVLYGRLKAATSGPGAYHFHADCDADYFEQLTAKEPKRVWRNGRWTRRYELPRGKRDEVQDCEVLALVALELSSLGRRRLNAMPRTPTDGSSPVVPAVAEPSREPAPEPPPTDRGTRRPRAPRRGWAFRV